MEIAAPRPRRRSELTQEAFDRFLACLDTNRDAAGRRYIELRRNLVRFFEWRGCPFPEDHADEAITRTASRIADGGEVREPAQYVIGVARLVLLEIRRDQERQRAAAAIDPPKQAAFDPADDVDARVDCLRRCLGQLARADRDLILAYYEGDTREKIENRQRLTGQLRVTITTLRARALRIRQRLQRCVEACLDALHAYPS